MPKKKQKKVLVVEDERAIGRAMKLKLEKSGHSAELATNGQEALQKLKEHTFDIMLLDLIMPQMDGFTVLERLKEQGYQIKTVVTTNLSQKEDEERARKLGAKGYLVKSHSSIQEIVEYVEGI